jgi:ABC-type glycerol-3-phosphate transport system substrate-binding protein
MQSNRHSLSRRQFLRVTGGVGAAALLAACAPAAGPGGEGAAPDGERSLEFWMWNTFAPPADEQIEESLRTWADENGVNIEISRDSDANQQTKVMPALEAGTLPDAMFVGSGPALMMMDANGTVALTDLFPEIGEAHGGWLPRLEEYVTRDGEVHFLPYSIDTPMTQYRMDIFEEAGIEVPEGQWTWEQTRDLSMQAQQFTEEQGNGMVGWGFGVVRQQHDGWCEDLFRNMGADIWDETGENIILAEENMEEATKALNFAKEAWDMGLFPSDAASWDYASNNKAYQEDQAILVINAASIFVWATENKPELAEVTGLAPKPAAERDTTNASLRYTVVMTQDVRDQELATDLIRDLYTSEIYAPWLEKGFVANVLHEYDDLPMWTGKRAQFNLAANQGVYPGYPAPYDNAAMADLLGPNNPFGTMVVRVLLDGWTPEEAIEEADQFSKDVFRRYF